ncbi:hypothetical protein BHE74_00033188 [Ensete ventricosum]|nr:hypothetical protein BHE74_00033188 [Ensete ventricosum]
MGITRTRRYISVHQQIDTRATHYRVVSLIGTVSSLLPPKLQEASARLHGENKLRRSWGDENDVSSPYVGRRNDVSSPRAGFSSRLREDVSSPCAGFSGRRNVSLHGEKE